jgi:hypothetical protein
VRLAGYLVERFLDFGECGFQASAKSLSGFGQRNTPGGTRKQTDAHFFFKRSHGVTHG